MDYNVMHKFSYSIQFTLKGFYTMRKILALLLCSTLLLTAVACNSSDTQDTTAKETEKVVATEKEEAPTNKETEKVTETEEATTKEVVTEKATETTEKKETAPTETASYDKTLVFNEGTASEDRLYDIGYKWDKDTATLTINGLNLETTDAIGIKIDGNAKLVIDDNSFNTISVIGYDKNQNSDYYLGCYGILCTGDLEVSGSGILNLTCGDFISDLVGTGIKATGIGASGDITWKSGTLNLTCGTIGDNSANLRNILGFSCTNMNVEGGDIHIDTGDCFTSDLGAFLDGIYARENYYQNGGEVYVNIGYCHIIGDELWRENIGICADTSISVLGGLLEVLAGHGSALGGGGFEGPAPTIDLGKGRVTAGASNKGTNSVYNGDLYLKVVY